MRQIMILLATVVVAVLVSACGKSSPVAPIGQTDFSMTNPVSVQMVQMSAKPTVRSATDLPKLIRVEPVGPGGIEANRVYQKSGRATKPTPTYGVVNATVFTQDGKQAFGGREYFLDFTQSFSDWVGTNFGVDGEVSLSLPGGYYRAQLVMYYTNQGGQFMGTIAEWSSLPIRTNQVNEVRLTIGGQGSVSYSIPNYSGPSLTRSSDDLKGPMIEGQTWDYFRVNLTAPQTQDILVESVQLMNSGPLVFDLGHLIGVLTTGGLTTGDGQRVSLVGIGYSSMAWLYKPENDLVRIPKGTSVHISVGGAAVGTGTMTLKIRIRYYYAGDPFAGEPDGQLHEIEGPAKVVTVISMGVFKIGYNPNTPLSLSIEGGSLSVPVLKLDFYSLYESILLSQIGFKVVGNSKAVVKITLWDEYGLLKLGEGVFSTGDYAIITLLHRLRINNGEGVGVTLKADFSPTGVAYPAKSGDKVQIGWFSSGGDDGTWGVGESSGSRIYLTSNSITFIGGTITLK